jgi:putative heme iron utilization protein
MDEAWAARCLLREQRSATLATQSSGQPFASLVTPAVAADGSVLMLLSTLSTHSRHLAEEPRCAIMVAGVPTDLNPQTAPRLTVTGVAERSGEAALKLYWLARHPYARLYFDFLDFVLWRVVPEEGLFIGGFARATRLSKEDLVPPRETLAAFAAEEAAIVAWCNAERADALGRLAHVHGTSGGAAGRWTMIGLDCDGFDLVQDETVLRIAFDAPAGDAAAARAAFSRMEGALPGRWRR